MRASVKELSKVTDTDELAMYEGVWGEMHVEYDVMEKNPKRRLNLSLLVVY